MLEVIANSVGIAYLMVLSVLGYAVLFTVINKIVISKPLRICLVTINFIFGITAIMLFPAVYYRSTISQHDEITSLIFAAVVVIGLVIVFRILSIINKSVEWK